jgi:K(+)-stimulated pyrophosphate-energized sodium pump
MNFAMFNVPAFWIAPLGVLSGLLFAGLFFRDMLRQDAGTELMQRIGSHVHRGAMAYLGQQYRIMLLVFVAIALLLAILAFGFDLQNRWAPATFMTGGLVSTLAGWIGMQTATRAATRTAAAARTSLAGALQVAFRSGAVIGLVVVSLGLAGVVAWLLLAEALMPGDTSDGRRLVMITTTLLTFSMGASLQALFARVGGGIYTKAADVGADLVGKVEQGIPEDDPRNPAVIADNVGDNVGDVAGMGADLFESYCGSLLAACALGAAAWVHDPAVQLKMVIAPLAIAGLGILLSVLGVFMVTTREGATQKDLLGSLARSINTVAALILAGSAALLHWLQLPSAWNLWGAVAAGLVTGIVVGRATEYSTSAGYGPTRAVACQSEQGAATVVIAGMGLGMKSTAVPVLAVATGTLLAFLCASGFDITRLDLGLYGIAIAAVGMLSTLGITLASDSYGPIADNAGGTAQMCGLGPEVRARTDALDALGNTTAATGKGFAIGSAALTGLALIASYVEVVRMEMLRLGETLLLAGTPAEVEVSNASLADFMMHFNVTLLNPVVLAAMFIGAMVTFVFSGMTIQAVGRVAGAMVAEVRRQFAADPGIIQGTSEPDYARCVAISTRGAQREMVMPALLAVLAPILVGLLLGVAGVIGLLAGGLASGFVLAVFLSNAGGAFDNAKKYIEEGHHGGKNSAAHHAAVIGDTVGDPLKDTAGPSLNIVVKLMSIVAIVMAGVTVSCSFL